ncbi:MAG: signal peptidase I [Lachnospiraceae bacterium]|nr:signal peptidase I [Lachnospiraceae bacterium]
MNRRDFYRFKENLKKKLRFSSGLNFRRKRHRFDADTFRYWALLIGQLVAVILLAFFVTVSFGYRVPNQGESMTKTIPDGSSVWVNKIAYKFSEPEAGDIIAFLPNGNTSASYSIKRVVATAGDSVVIKNGRLYVNDEQVELTNLDADLSEPGRAYFEITLDEGEYFVLGDNPSNSEDSRYESVGNVTDDQILGKVWCVCSLKGFGLVH